MTTREPDPDAREISERVRSRMPRTLTGAEHRSADAVIAGFVPEFRAIYRRIAESEQHLTEGIDAVAERVDQLDEKLDRLGAHVIDRLGEQDQKIDALDAKWQARFDAQDEKIDALGEKLDQLLERSEG